MFCPKCGKADQTPDAYCRACGEWLPDVNSLQRGRVKLPPEKRLQATIIFNLLSAVFALISVIALIISISGKEEPNPGVIIAISFCFTIVAWQIVSFVFTFQFQQELKRRRQKKQFRDDQLSPAANANNALPSADTSDFIYPQQSVTENTTSLLEPVIAKNTKNFER